MDRNNICFRLLDHRRLWNRIVLLLMEGRDNPNAQVFRFCKLISLKHLAFNIEFGIERTVKVTNDCWACEYAQQAKKFVKARFRCDCCPISDNVCNDDDDNLYGKLADLINDSEHYTRAGLEQAISLARQIRDTAVKDEIKTI